ncbi:Transposon Ty3-I Gag-Pol poly [Pelomyxa schiedti]|nr:Transposon Ty3-I Gag-Pol poly [Pelomyxa schiedti]
MLITKMYGGLVRGRVWKRIRRKSKLSLKHKNSEVRSFLGLVGYYRQFVKDFAKLSAPLEDLKKKCAIFHWGRSENRAFGLLKTALATAPVLHYPDCSREFRLETDASDNVLAATLTQAKANGEGAPIVFISRRMRDAETRYHITEKEALAAAWAVEKLECYLWGKHFTLITDATAVAKMQTNEGKSRHLRYKNGLTRVNHKEVPEENDGKSYTPHGYIAVVLDTDQLPDLSQAQQEDAHYQDVWRACKGESLEAYTPEKQAELEAQKQWYTIQDEKLFHLEKPVKNKKAAKSLKLCVPEPWKNTIMARYHDSIQGGGHFGVFKTFHAIAAKYWWPNMYEDVRDWVESCPLCQQYRKATPGYSPKSIYAKYPNDIVAMDLWGPSPKSTKGRTMGLVMVDLYSKVVHLKALHDQSAATVVKAIEKIWITKQGCPCQLRSDRGTDFVAKVNAEFCRTWKIKQDRQGVREVIREKQAHEKERQHLAMKRRVTKLAKAMDVGTKVMLKASPNQLKAGLPKWNGPYRIIKVPTQLTRVLDFGPSQMEETVHVARLKLYVEGQRREVVSQPIVYKQEQVLMHRVTRHGEEFKVKFQGHARSEAQWMPRDEVDKEVLETSTENTATTNIDPNTNIPPSTNSEPRANIPVPEVEPIAPQASAPENTLLPLIPAEFQPDSQASAFINLPDDVSNEGFQAYTNPEIPEFTPSVIDLSGSAHTEANSVPLPPIVLPPDLFDPSPLVIPLYPQSVVPEEPPAVSVQPWTPQQVPATVLPRRQHIGPACLISYDFQSLPPLHCISRAIKVLQLEVLIF